MPLQQDLDIAATFCRMVQTSDLLEYLGLPRDAPAEQATEALAARRRRLQGMQNNPKYRRSARFLIKNYRALARALQLPDKHLEHARRQREEQLLPTLEMAIDGVLADGLMTPTEERFVHRAALSLGISESTYERVLAKRAHKAGVALADAEPSGDGPPPWTGGATAEVTTPEPEAPRGAEDHTWWDAGFTRLLLAAIPGGPGAMVDVYCRTGAAAGTLLPQRPQLSWFGLDRRPDRVEQARETLARFGSRARLEQGGPTPLPLHDDSVDYVLAVRALTWLEDTRTVFDEARRVLRPGGRVVVAEPDHLGETFCFGGHLPDYHRAFHRLARRLDVDLGDRGPPGGEPGLALGPRIPERMEAAGLVPVSTQVHAASTLQPRTFARLARLLRRYPEALARAAGHRDDPPELQALRRVVQGLEGSFEPERVALCGTVLPVYVTAGVLEA